jgi:hypothetical protein
MYLCLRLTFRQTTPPFCELSNDQFFVSKTVERAQLIFELSFNIAISNERVSLFAVLCAGKVQYQSRFAAQQEEPDR